MRIVRFLGTSRINQYRRLLISQDNCEIYLTFAEYDTTYVEYLRDAKPSQCGTRSFMVMNEFGPWDTNNCRHMKHLSRIVLAFTIQQSL